MKIKVIIIISCLALYFLVKRWVFPLIMSMLGKKYLYKKLFFKGETQKQEVLEKFHNITGHKFTDAQAIDFFMKEKGLQLLSVTPGSPLKVKYYLANDTKISLSYFEKVKFHETFIEHECLNLLDK